MRRVYRTWSYRAGCAARRGGCAAGETWVGAAFVRGAAAVEPGCVEPHLRCIHPLCVLHLQLLV